MARTETTKSGNGNPSSQTPQPDADVLKLMNNPQADEKAAALMSKLAKKKTARAQTGAEINAIRKELYAMGHKRDSVALLEKYLAMDEEQRAEVDLSLLNLRRACGLPLQMDIFEATKQATH